MAEQHVTRKLAAILVADVVGYSRLMNADEEGTLARLKALRAEAVDPTVIAHKGRLVKLMGDGALVEFGSAVDAVRCALDIQQALEDRDADLPEGSRIAFRVGINLGDVMVDGDDIYGDSVNLAARLESLADAGGICVTGAVHDQVAGKVPYSFNFIGERALKGFDEPVKIYAVSLKPSAPTNTPRTRSLDVPAVDVSRMRANLAGASGPAVAVLPFRNLSQDPEQDFFADGLGEDIILALSASRSFPVLARSATLAYKGGDVDVHSAGKELGAGYVLEGSVRRAGARLRISVELVSVDTRLQLWSERYERSIDDLFTIQDDITTSVVAVVEPEIDAQEMRRVLVAQPSIDMNAYEFAQQGFWHLSKNTPEDYQSSLRQFKSSLRADPRYARAYAGMTQGKYTAGNRLWEDRRSALEEAIQLGRAALDLDERDPRALRYFGGAHALLGLHDDALQALRRAIAIQPSYATAYSALAFVLNYVGDFDDALTAEATTERLRPGDRTLHVCMMSKALATYEMEDYERAESVCRRSLGLNNQYWMSNLMLAASLGQQGKRDEAQIAGKNTVRLMPDLSEAGLWQLMPFRERIHLDQIVEGLRKAQVELL